LCRLSDRKIGKNTKIKDLTPLILHMEEGKLP
jgi:hypothetical protein